MQFVGTHLLLGALVALSLGCDGTVDPYVGTELGEVPEELTDGSLSATGIIGVVNDRRLFARDYELAIGLSKATARALVQLRNGPDGMPDSKMVGDALVRGGDDVVVACMAELDALAGMDRGAFVRLEAYADKNGYTDARRLGTNRLYWAESFTLKSAELDGKNPTTLLQGEYPTGVAVDTFTHRLLWTDNMKNALDSATLDGREEQTLWQSTRARLSNPEAIAIDIVARTVFFTDPGEGVVYRERLDGSPPVVIANGQFPQGIAVDTAEKKVYFTDNGTDTIVRIDYDGSHAETLYRAADPYLNPTSIALDPIHHEMYWTEGRVVRKTSMDGATGGATPSLVLNDVWPAALALDLKDGRLFATAPDAGTTAIIRTNLDGTNRTVIYRSTERFSSPRRLYVLR